MATTPIREQKGVPAGAREDGTGAPVIPTLGLVVSIAAALIMVLASAAMLLIPSQSQPPPFPDQHQDAESLTFLLAFGIVLPLAVAVGTRAAERIARSHGNPALRAAALTLLAGLLGVVLVVRLVDLSDLTGALWAGLVLGAGWLAVAALVLWRLPSGDRPLLTLLSSEPGLRALSLVAVALGAAAVLVLVDLSAIALLPLIVGLLLTLGLVARMRSGVSGPAGSAPGSSAFRGRWGDAAVVGLLLLAVTNVQVFDLADPLRATVTYFHQNFFIGSANHVLGGDAMLVDTFSQYGVGSIYVVAGWFKLVPIGNGTLGLLEGLLSTAMFAGAFLVLRLAGTSWALATAALAVAVVALVYGLEYSLGALLQHGAIRFGLPLLLIVAAVSAARRPAWTRWARAVELLTVGIASIWALEAFAYTVLTFAALTAVRVGPAPRSRRRSIAVRAAADAAAAIVAAHLLLASLTLFGTGELPRWGRYLATLSEFLTGTVGELTYDFSPWSPALAVGAVYLTSAAALALLVRRGGTLVEDERVALLALSGSTAWGIGLLSYFVNRSADHILPYVSLPAVMVVVLWLSIGLRACAPGRPGVRLGLVGAAGVVASLLVAVAWPGAGGRFSESVLAHAAPGGPSLRAAFSRLWDQPPIGAGAGEGERLLEEHMPEEERSLVLTSADLGIEVLARSGRINALPLSDPWEQSFVYEQYLPDLRAEVARLEPGDRVLVDDVALDAFDAYRREPHRDPLVEPIGEETIVPTGLAKLQEWALKAIGERFDLRQVARGSDGVAVVELVPRGGAAPGGSGPELPRGQDPPAVQQ